MRSARPPAVTALTIAFLGSGLALAGAPSFAAAPMITCQGRPATVVGSTGTEGDDVMVVVPTAGVMARALGGNDLICIVAAPEGGIRTVAVDAGAGNDSVVNETADVDDVWYTTILGAGEDSYVGLDAEIPDNPRASPFYETVFAGDRDLSRAGIGETLDTERDTIDTGAGADVVHSGSSSPGAINGDTVSTGPGADELYWGGEQTGTVDLGTGGDRLEVHPGWRGSAVTVDARARVATVDGRPVLRWTGDAHRYVLSLDNPDVSFVGSGADESLFVLPPGGFTPTADSAGHRSVSMGGGDDHLDLAVLGTGTIDGGPGRDSFGSRSCLTARVTIGGTFRCIPWSEQTSTYALAFDRWEDLFVEGGDVGVVGSPRADRIKVVADRVRVRGRGGDDVLNANSGYAPDPVRSVVIRGGAGDDRVVGSHLRDRLLGGRGDDRLFGDARGDTLLGGAGRDKAFGQHGRDVCMAEVRRTCERS